MTTYLTPGVRREDAIGTPPQRPTLVPADHLTVMCGRPGADADHGELVMMLWMRMPPGAPPDRIRGAGDDRQGSATAGSTRSGAMTRGDTGAGTP